MTKLQKQKLLIKLLARLFLVRFSNFLRENRNDRPNKIQRETEEEQQSVCLVSRSP